MMKKIIISIASLSSGIPAALCRLLWVAAFLLLSTSRCSFEDIGDIAVDKLFEVKPNPMFVAVGDSGSIFYSPDGITWTQASSPVTFPLYAVTLGNGRFVAVGNMSTVVTSDDGKNWTDRTFGGSIPLFTVTYGNGLYIAAGQWMSLKTQVWSSPDGVAWTDRSIAAGTQTMNSITFGNGRIYTVGNNFQGWFTDNSGLTWNTSDQIGSTYYGAIYANNKFTVVGAGSMIRESPTADAGTWVNANFGTFPGQIYAVTFGNGYYVAAGDSGTIVYSPDGFVWIQSSVGPVNLRGITFRP